MAKKTAVKKKSSAVKAKLTKPIKTVKATRAMAKQIKSSGKPIKAVFEKPAKRMKPALMTKKGKTAEESLAEKPEAVKAKTVVSIMEADPLIDENEKVEKINKVKPVKVDRGNAADEKIKWAELFKKYGKEKAFAYKMTEIFSTLVPLQHKVLGWGFILTNENDRLEVLFETGIRMLISNYKG